MLKVALSITPNGSGVAEVKSDGLRSLNKYLKSGEIYPPVRAWENINQAERMSLQTGRRIILRLKFPDNAKKLEGHFNEARVINYPYKITNNNY